MVMTGDGGVDGRRPSSPSRPTPPDPPNPPGRAKGGRVHAGGAARIQDLSEGRSMRVAHKLHRKTTSSTSIGEVTIVDTSDRKRDKHILIFFDGRRGGAENVKKQQARIFYYNG